MTACVKKERGRIACTLIPFTVLKHLGLLFLSGRHTPIACTLIPFTVLKLVVSLPCLSATVIIACTLIPFTVLKHGFLSRRSRSVPNCMHPYTVYGIETNIKKNSSLDKHWIACTLIPFTVLKRPTVRDDNGYCLHCMHPYTVYGIETTQMWSILIILRINCMHPYTVYGIETQQPWANHTNLRQLHAPLYRLRY